MTDEPLSDIAGELDITCRNLDVIMSFSQSTCELLKLTFEEVEFNITCSYPKWISSLLILK